MAQEQSMEAGRHYGQSSQQKRSGSGSSERQAEEAEEVARVVDQAREVQDQHNWEADRRLNLFSGGKNQDEMERRSLRMAQEQSMEASGHYGQSSQQKGS
eukprot:6925401-Heterocapsa_arctica.AAC.1